MRLGVSLASCSCPTRPAPLARFTGRCGPMATSPSTSGSRWPRNPLGRNRAGCHRPLFHQRSADVLGGAVWLPRRVVYPGPSPGRALCGRVGARSCSMSGNGRPPHRRRSFTPSHPPWRQRAALPRCVYPCGPWSSWPVRSNGGTRHGHHRRHRCPVRHQPRLRRGAPGRYSTQSATKMFVSPRSRPCRLEANTSRRPSGLNIGKPSNSALVVNRSSPLPSTPIR